jgi:hypothetical protein
MPNIGAPPVNRGRPTPRQRDICWDAKRATAAGAPADPPAMAIFTPPPPTNRTPGAFVVVAGHITLVGKTPDALRARGAGENPAAGCSPAPNDSLQPTGISNQTGSRCSRWRKRPAWANGHALVINSLAFETGRNRSKHARSPSRRRYFPSRRRCAHGSDPLCQLYAAGRIQLRLHDAIYGPTADAGRLLFEEPSPAHPA